MIVCDGELKMKKLLCITLLYRDLGGMDEWLGDRGKEFPLLMAWLAREIMLDFSQTDRHCISDQIRSPTHPLLLSSELMSS